jgi:hypothetical protein
MIAGCSSASMISDFESQARRHMAMADTLERAESLKKATLEYTFIAERFPTTSVYPAAVRKAAFLYSMSSNPAASDSASAYWLETYRRMARSPEEKQLVEICLMMVERVRNLRDSLSNQTGISDSLAITSRKQSTELASRGKKIQDLEAQLQRASEELLKLKEIDMRISTSRGKNKP